MSAIYKMAKAIYNEEERLVNGKEKLFLSHGINKNSFADFYRAFQKMLDGELHTRGISTDLRDYFLSQIYKDYGADKFIIRKTKCSGISEQNVPFPKRNVPL